MHTYSNGNRSALLSAVFCGLTAAIAAAFGWWVIGLAGKASVTANHLEDLSTGRELGPWQQSVESRLKALDAK